MKFSQLPLMRREGKILKLTFPKDAKLAHQRLNGIVKTVCGGKTPGNMMRSLII